MQQKENIARVVGATKGEGFS